MKQSPFSRHAATPSLSIAPTILASLRTTHTYFYSRQHFPKILAGTMLVSGCVGYAMMGWWMERRLEERAEIYLSAYNNNNGESSRMLALSRKLTVNGGEIGLNRRVTQFW